MRGLVLLGLVVLPSFTSTLYSRRWTRIRAFRLAHGTVGTQLDRAWQLLWIKNDLFRSTRVSMPFFPLLMTTLVLLPCLITMTILGRGLEGGIGRVEWHEMLRVGHRWIAALRRERREVGTRNHSVRLTCPLLIGS